MDGRIDTWYEYRDIGIDIGIGIDIDVYLDVDVDINIDVDASLDVEWYRRRYGYVTFDFLDFCDFQTKNFLVKSLDWCMLNYSNYRMEIVGCWILKHDSLKTKLHDVFGHRRIFVDNLHSNLIS